MVKNQIHKIIDRDNNYMKKACTYVCIKRQENVKIKRQKNSKKKGP